MATNFQWFKFEACARHRNSLTEIFVYLMIANYLNLSLGLK